jgi:hypothetical protein
LLFLGGHLPVPLVAPLMTVVVTILTELILRSALPLFPEDRTNGP